MLKFTIQTAPRTKKNSSRILINRKTGKRFIAPSQAFVDYQNKCGWLLTGVKNSNIDKKINIKAIYYMDTHRRVDLTNLNGALHDVLVKYRVIVDDDSKIVVGTDGSRVKYDKKDPRTEIEITEVDDV